MRNLFLICICSFLMFFGDMFFNSVFVIYLLKIGSNSFIYILKVFIFINL